MYAPSSSAWERMELWEELLILLPRNGHWIFVGDWNFVENRCNKSTSYGHLALEQEKLVFSDLTSALQVEDCFPASNQIWFSWDNKCQNGVRVLARLDRIYSFQAANATQVMTHYEILGNNNHSDHLPVKGRIML